MGIAVKFEITISLVVLKWKFQCNNCGGIYHEFHCFDTLAIIAVHPTHNYAFYISHVSNCYILLCFTFQANQIVDENSVNEICTKYAVFWRQIGLKLGLDASVLNNVESDYRQQRNCFEATLRKWMNLAGNNATWGALELAITNANREDLSLEALTSKLYASLSYVVATYVVNCGV